MYLAPTTEQQELKDAVRRFCRDEITPERLLAWDKEPSGIDDACWRTISGLGWFGLGLPSSAGGSGLGLVEVACLLEECARGLVPRRVINAIRAGLALAAVDPDCSELAALARGEGTVTLAFDEQEARAAEQFLAEVHTRDGVLQLSGEKWFIADGASADLHLVAAGDGPALGFFLIERRHAQLTPLRTFDGERQVSARYDRAPACRVGPRGDATERFTVVRRQQTALALAEMVGGMDAVLSMTVEYVKQREQFGQKLAVFQAVQHQVADMATTFTAARHLAWQALARMAAGTEEGGELPMAAAFVGQGFKRLALAAHHLHGGAGYVVEHPLHYHAERAQALCIRYAPEAPALAAVAAQLLSD